MPDWTPSEPSGIMSYWLRQATERFAARRCTIIPYKAADDSSRPTVQSVLDLFDRLNPRDQLDRVMLVIGMPFQHRPSDTLELFRRQDKIVDWAAGAGGTMIAKL